MPERPRGVSPLGARRGGPGTFTGVDYQLTVMTYWALTLIDDAQRHPTRALILRIEPRTLVPEGQVGDDLGWSGSRQHGTRRIEIKSNPTVQDVRDFIERLGALDAEPESAFIVAGSETSAFDDLGTLINLAFEAADDSEFDELLQRHDRGRGNLVSLAAHAGAQPRTVLRRAAAPECATERFTDRQVTNVAQTLAVPGRAPELLAILHRRLITGARRREALDIGALVEELHDRRVLQPAATIDYTDESDTVVAALALLDALPTALPAALVASVLGVSVRELDQQLADQVTAGHVVNVQGNLSCALHGVVHPRLADYRAQTLSELTTMASADATANSEQAPNILFLAERVIRDRPHLVAEVFVAFEKGAKLFGDLFLTWRLAHLAFQACEAAGDGADSTEIRRLQDHKVRSIICGKAWVLQRVGELERADAWLTKARTLNEGTADFVNDAFLDKCTGRLKRLLAEDQPVGSTPRQDYLRESEAMLVSAHDKFRRVVVNGETRCLDDVGECQSLLARTYWEANEQAKARAAVDFALTYLPEFTQSKAAADLAILQIEMELAAYDDQNYAEDSPQAAGLQVGIARIGQIIAVYSGDAHAGLREPSEIIARCLLLRARLAESTSDTDQASADLAAAAELYRVMNYLPAAADAEVRRIVLTGQVPPGLLAELDRRNASAGTRLHALQHTITRAAAERVSSTGEPTAQITEPTTEHPPAGRSAGPATSDDGDYGIGDGGDVANLVWESVVTEAERRDVLTSPSWGLSLPLGA